MELTTVFYIGPSGVGTHHYSGTWTHVDGGVVLHLNDRTHTFIPWHRVIEIEQTFDGDATYVERQNISLAARMGRK